MRLRMIGYGMLAGAAVILTMTILRSLAAREGARLAAAGAAEGHISAEVWLVLAEARRILEESGT